MPEQLNRAVEALKAQVGLPVDVTPTAGSSPVVGTQANLQKPPVRPTPAQQQAAAEQAIARANALTQAQVGTEPPVAQGLTPEQILAAKDKAITDGQDRIKELEKGSQTMTAEIETLKASANNLPENFETLTKEAQTQAVAEELYRQRRETDLKEQRKELEGIVGQLKNQAATTQVLQAAEDERQIRGLYPSLDYAKHKSEIERKRAELPGLSALDALRLVAPPQELVSPTQVPFAQASVPSMRAAMDQSPAPNTQGLPTVTKNQVIASIGNLQMQGRTVEANSLIDELLRKTVTPPSSLRRQNSG